MHKTVLLVVAVVMTVGCGEPNGGGSGNTGGGDASGGGASSGGGSAVTGGGDGNTGGGAQLGGGIGTGGGSTTGGGAATGGGSAVVDAGCDSRCIEGDYAGMATTGSTTYATTFRVIAVDPQRARVLEVFSGQAALGDCQQGDEPLVFLDGGAFVVDENSTPQNAQNFGYGTSCTPGGVRPASATGVATTYVQTLEGNVAGSALSLTATVVTNTTSGTTNTTSTTFTGTRTAGTPDAGITVYWADQGRGIFNFATPFIPRTTKSGSDVAFAGQAFIASGLTVADGGVDTTVQTLPAWWRPASTQTFEITGQVSANPFTATLRVYEDGRVTVGQNVGGTTPFPLGSNAHLNLDGVDFTASH